MRRLIATATMLLALFAAERADGTIYTVRDLGTLGGQRSWAAAINDAGQIAGGAELTDDIGHAFLYEGSAMRDLGTLGGDGSGARDINESGIVVGASRTHPGTFSPWHAFRYQDGVMVDLDPVEERYSWADAVNTSGTIVGWCNLADPGPGVFLHDGAMMRLVPEISGGYPGGYGINDSGAVVCAIAPAYVDYAALWDGSTVLDLSQIALGGRMSSAFDINESGAVIGQMCIPICSNDIEVHAFLYDGSSATDLGTLGGTLSRPYSINDLGQVVGESTAPIAGGRSEYHAFIYENGAMSDLNDLLTDPDGWILTGARDINNLGQIVGNGLHNGVERAFLLTPVSEDSLGAAPVPESRLKAVPVPEPPTLALLGMGGLALLACRRARRSGRGRPVPLS